MNARAAETGKTELIVETTLGVINELAEVLAEEVALLKKQNVQDMQTLLRRKNELIMRYRSNMKVLAANPELVKKTPAEMRAKLKAAGANLAGITQSNLKALKGAAGAAQRLIDFIINHVKKEALPQLGYADPRKGSFDQRPHSPTCPPLAVSRTA